ncbi:MAG TPA: phosphatase PAP2 family protein [Planctomycetota bacterium]|nr:phosphatase PAP2 family protein [Planctomycetota bacterium]
MKKLAAFDLVNLAYIAVISLIVIVVHPPGSALFLGLHAAAAAWIGLILYAHGRFDGRFWTFLRYWYVLPFVLCAFREIHYLVPLVHPFDDHRFDRMLQSLDQRWFGDVDRIFLGTVPPVLVDILHLCYWFYYVALLIPGGVLFRRQDWPRLREFLSITMMSLLTSYLGYFAVPAIGPHHFLLPRPAALDGWALGGVMHRMVIAAELTMPDAFPSGHALMSLVVIALTWRLYRPAFKFVLGPCLGCILATVALRYHYVVDVVASVVLFPAVFLAGVAFNRWRDSGVVPGPAAPPR